MQVIDTIDGIREFLKKKCKKEGNIAKWAKKHKFVRSYITEVINGKYDPTKSERLMKALGLEHVSVWYESKNKPSSKEIKKFLRAKAERKARLTE